VQNAWRSLWSFPFPPKVGLCREPAAAMVVPWLLSAWSARHPFYNAAMVGGVEVGPGVAARVKCRPPLW